MEEFTVLASPMQPHLENLIRNCSRDLLIASPYIRKSAVDWLVESKSPLLERITVLTNLSMENVLSKSLEITALRRIFESFSNTSIVSLQRLHAKVFIADESLAIVTSANLTNGGLWANYEYGIAIKQKTIVANIVKDMVSYSTLGGVVSRDLLNIIEKKIGELNAMQEQAESNPATRTLRRQIHKSQVEIQDALLSYRLPVGQTINNLFANTIVWILRKHPAGLTTAQIHREVQAIHPDICDDSIDRIINGQRHGKKWKHHVRRAQEFLKGKNLITNESGTWRISANAI